jgi:hypothetical protein
MVWTRQGLYSVRSHMIQVLPVARDPSHRSLPPHHPIHSHQHKRPRLRQHRCRCRCSLSPGSAQRPSYPKHHYGARHPPLSSRSMGSPRRRHRSRSANWTATATAMGTRATRVRWKWRWMQTQARILTWAWRWVITAVHPSAGCPIISSRPRLRRAAGKAKQDSKTPSTYPPLLALEHATPRQACTDRHLLVNPFRPRSSRLSYPRRHRWNTRCAPKRDYNDSSPPILMLYRSPRARPDHREDDSPRQQTRMMTMMVSSEEDHHGRDDPGSVERVTRIQSRTICQWTIRPRRQNLSTRHLQRGWIWTDPLPRHHHHGPTTGQESPRRVQVKLVRDRQMGGWYQRQIRARIRTRLKTKTRTRTRTRVNRRLLPTTRLGQIG